jgi:CelD/BcsL family acetyltransferase involved in cellulose biosynthesis
MDLRQPAVAGGDVLAALRSSVRWRIRRSLRALAPVETEWAEDVDAALSIFGELVELHQARWTAAGDTGVFASRRFEAFHRDLIPRLMETRQVVLFRVRSATGTVGCVYGHLEDRRMLQYQSGFATFDDNRIKPGLTVHALCMQACMERGLHEYDLLAGGNRYKRELATSQRELVWGQVSARRPRAMVVHGLRRLHHVRRRLRDSAAPADGAVSGAAGSAEAR